MDGNLLKVGITVGDINGIGPEIILKVLSDPLIMKVCTPVVYGSSKVFSFYRKLFNLSDFQFNYIKTPLQAGNKIPNLIKVWEEEIKIHPGQATEESGKAAFLSLKRAAADLKEGVLDALVTAPINKKNIRNPEFNFTGHTDYLAAIDGSKDYLMLLINNGLRVSTVTGHIPISEVSKQISKEKIINKVQTLINTLKQDFRIRKPKIAILGLNPHNGDNGLMGNEEQSIITPAIDFLKNEGHIVFGPFAADGFFGSGNYGNFDCILSMYHDQGLTPFKTLSFGGGVNFTAGLSFIRTSPDHGVGYDIAGKGLAKEDSLREAIYNAIDIYHCRKEYQALNRNPLAYSKQKSENKGIE